MYDFRRNYRVLLGIEQQLPDVAQSKSGVLNTFVPTRSPIGYKFVAMCVNCNRRVVEGSAHPMSVNLVHSSIIPSRKKKFQHNDAKRITGVNSCNYTLCRQCHDYLLFGED